MLPVPDNVSLSQGPTASFYQTPARNDDNLRLLLNSFPIIIKITFRDSIAALQLLPFLLNVKLSGGEYLIKDKKITGFSWFEESLAGRKKEVPFDLEAALEKRGADYEKALIPMTSKVVVDCNLITGQNPFSSKEMAEVVMRQLSREK